MKRRIIEMGVEDKYPGYTYHNYKENHPVHQFNSGKTNSHVRINGTVYIDDGSGPVPLIEDYDKLNNKTFQDLMKPGLPAPLYLKDLDYDGEFPTTSNEYKVASKLLNLVTAKGTMPCTWSLAGAEDERIVFVEPTKEGSNLIKFNLGGYVYSMEVLSDKVITKTKPIDEGSDDYDKLNDDIFQEFVSTIGIPTPFGLKSLDFTSKHPDSSYEYKLASALKTKLENGEDLKCTWSVSGDKDESVIFVTPTLTDGCIKFTLGGNLYSMEFTDDNKIDCTTTPINEFKDYDVFCDETFQEFAKTCGFTTDIQLKDLNYNTTVARGSKEYNLFNEILTNGTIKYTWSIDDKEYIFVEPTKYDDNIVAFTLGGTLYKMEVSDDTLSMKFTTEPLNKLRHESDYWMDYYTELTTTAPELKQLLQTDATYYDEGTDEYTVLKTLYDESLANGNMKALYEYSTLSDGSTERLMCDVTASVNNVLYICYGQDLIRAKFMDDDGDYILLNRYNTAEENDLYNNWFQKWYYEIDSDNHADQFFILNALNVAKPKHYAVGTDEYDYVKKVFLAFSSREKEIVKFPVGIAPSFEGQDAIICVNAINYSGIYGDEVVTEIDFEMGHYNYRLIWAIGSEYVCLDRQNKYDSPEKQFDTLMNQAYKGGKCPTVDVEFSDDGHEIEVEDSSDIKKLNSLRKYATEDMSYSLAPSMGDTVILIPAGPVLFPSSAFGIDNKYQLNNLYSNLLISCNYYDPSKEVYTWSVGDCLYVMTYDVDNDKWYTRWQHNATVMYDSESWYEYFNKVVLNNVRPGTLGSHLNIAGAVKQDSQLYDVIEAIHTWYDTHALKPVDIPWTGDLNSINGPRFTTSRVYPIDGYGSATSHHRGLLIKRANVNDLCIDYMEDDNGVPFYYATNYNQTLRDAMLNVTSKTDANYLKPYYDVRRIATSPLQVKETCFLGKLISTTRFAEGLAYRTSTTVDSDVFYNIQKIISKAITGSQFDITAHNYDGAYIPWEEEDGNTGFVRHGITTAKLNPWGAFNQGNPTEVKNFIVDVSHTGIYYILKFNDKVADATECTVWYGGHMSSREMTAIIDWQEACYECGLIDPSSAKYKAMWGCLSYYAWATTHKTVTDVDDLRMFKVVSVAANKAKSHLSDVRIHHLMFNGYWDVTTNGTLDKQTAPARVTTTIESLDNTLTEFTFTVGGSKFYIKLDAPGLSATQAEVWYKEL